MSELISYDPSGAFLTGEHAQYGITAADLEGLADRLYAVQGGLLAEAIDWSDPPADKQPLDAAFHRLPERLLEELIAKGDGSEVRRLIATGNRLAGLVDRVVVLGIGGSYMGARALLEALCHPYHNEASKEQRGGRPRISFEGNNVDNDAAAGLIDLLRSEGDRWAIAVISKSGGTLETAAALRVFLRELQSACGGDAAKVAERLVPVTGQSGKLFDLSTALGCQEIYEVPDGVGGRFSVLSAVGLLPAAVLGLDVVKILEGAVAMNEHFATAAPAENVVLQYVGVCHLMETMRGCDIRLLSTWGKRLEAVGLWYDQLLSESLGKAEQGAMPLTVVNTRDLHSRGQQHQEGKRDKLITNVTVDTPATAPIAIGASDHNQDQLNELAEKTLPDVLSAATAGTNQAYLEDGRPTTHLRLPKLDEHRLGQLLQMLMLATVVEGRLIGINPYGQPGVEAYKKNMNAILRA
ncbi:MAG: glucose-6-phosphate isomerase [Planctomycetota bacterium]